MNIGVLRWKEWKAHDTEVPAPPPVPAQGGPEGGRAPHLTVWSQIFTVQSELQEMKTLVWYGFQDTASTAMLWAS